MQVNWFDLHGNNVLLHCIVNRSMYFMHSWWHSTGIYVAYIVNCHLSQSFSFEDWYSNVMLPLHHSWMYCTVTSCSPSSRRCSRHIFDTERRVVKHESLFAIARRSPRKGLRRGASLTPPKIVEKWCQLVIISWSFWNGIKPFFFFFFCRVEL